jgi:hypothetical protein
LLYVFEERWPTGYSLHVSILIGGSTLWGA